MSTQLCRTCGLVKPLSDFDYRKDTGKYNTECKACKKEYKKAWQIKNRASISVRKKGNYQDNKEAHNERSKKYSRTHAVEISLNKKSYYKENKTQIQETQKEYRKQEDLDHKRFRRRTWENDRLKNDPAFRLRKDVSRYINLALNSMDSSKLGKSIVDHLDYSFSELKAHIESKFEPWMNWQNWGRYDPKTWDDNNLATWAWQIDHIIPHSIFHYTSMEDEEFQKCWALTNLRPLSAKQNYLDGINRTRHNA